MDDESFVIVAYAGIHLSGPSSPRISTSVRGLIIGREPAPGCDFFVPNFWRFAGKGIYCLENQLTNLRSAARMVVDQQITHSLLPPTKP